MTCRPTARISLLIAVSLCALTLRAEPLTIEDAIELAITRNERAAIAGARLDAARARVNRARSFFFPDVTVTGTFIHRSFETVRIIDGEEVTISSRDAATSTVNLSQTLFDLRAIPIYRQAKFEAESARFDSKDEVRRIAFEAAEAFLRTLGSEQVLRAAERRRDFARESKDDGAARFEAGLVSSNDVTRADLELATAERELSLARGNTATAYLQLGNLLLGEVEGPLATPSGLIEPVPLPVPEETESIVKSAQERRDDVTALRLHARALDAFAREPNMRWFPTLNLSGQFRRTSDAGLNGREQDGSVSMLFNWSVFEGGERNAERAERLALAKIATLEADAAHRGVSLEVRQALVALESERDSLVQAIVATTAAGRNAEETNALYRQGLASALELADANVRRFEAEIAEVNARYAIAIAHLDLRAARGLEPLD